MSNNNTSTIERRTIRSRGVAARRTPDDSIELAAAARELISGAALRRTLELFDSAPVGTVLAIPIREAFRAAVDREMVTLRREREGLQRSIAAARGRA